MKKTRLLFALFCAASLFVGCNEDDGPSGGTPSDSNFEENFGAAASRDFIGQVVDMSNHAIQGATVKVGSTSVQTDSNGMFVINGASVHEKFAYITASKLGFFEGSRALVPTSGKNNVRIMLIPDTPTATVPSGSASEVTTDSGSKIMFDGAFQDENGQAYSGDVSVSVFHLQSSDDNLASLMPGMLYAERENGNEATLQTFGMLNVELRGSGGQKLQPAQGHPASLEFTIDASQSATAPMSIPLWHFDAEKGWWKEDGIATRQGNKYVGEASHFSWWNCDAPFPTVNLTVTLTDADGNPIANAGVGITYSNWDWPAMGYTSQNGQVSGLVPANETLTINVYNICGEVVYTATEGPFTADATLSITAESGTAQPTLVQGVLQNCAGENVTSGYVLMQYGNHFNFAQVEDGSFSFSALVCSTGQSFTLLGGDFDSLQQTDSITYTFSTPVTNVGSILACNTVDEFISYQIDDEPSVYLIQNVSASSGSAGQTNGLSISGYNQGTPTNPNDFQSLYIYSSTAITPGVYSTMQFSLEGTLGYIHSATTNDIVFNLTSVGAVGEYIDLNFSGTYEEDGVTHTISGVAHVIRNN